MKKGIYEPKLGKNGSNPEARLIFDGDIKVDVEVKTPGFKYEEEKRCLIPAMILT